jgi:CDP-diacylglycerol--glycerol-3-phosphate 3-phosphatidyltransferase
MTIPRSEIVTVPNILSFYRLVMAPVIVWFAFEEYRNLFIIFLVISLLSDVLDGLIARIWNVQTKLGARLDSIADDLTYVAALVGIFQFEYQTLKPHIGLLYVFIGFLVLTTVVPLVKFKKTPAFHLYSFRANGYIQAFFILHLFVIGFNVYFYYFALGFGILACMEVIAVALAVDRPVTNVRGLYWVLRDKNG